MSNRERGYNHSWRPHRKTIVLLEQIDEILAEYEQHLPMTVRQIFYRLVGNHGYPKDERAYSRLCETLNRARRSERVPFWKIRDDGVTGYNRRWFSGEADFWDEAVGRAHKYLRDRQIGQPQRIELWCESAGMLPQLARVADDYSIPVRSASGFTSVTGTFAIAQRAADLEVPTVILHVGDYDPSGTAIFHHMIEDAAAFLARDRMLANLSLRGVRVALTAAQVEAYELPTAPPKTSDSRSRGWTETCQAEALSPSDLASIVRTAIEAEIDLGRWRREVEIEALDRDGLLRQLTTGFSS